MPPPPPPPPEKTEAEKLLEYAQQLRVTIVNVHEVEPRVLAMWVNMHLLNERLPAMGPNSSIDPRSQLVPFFAVLANKRAFATELWNVITGRMADAKHWSTLATKAEGRGNQYEHYKAKLEASAEILKRTIYALEGLYEAASRTMSGMEPKMLGNR